MKDYKRLTKKGSDWLNDVYCDEQEVYMRLEDLENLIEQGKLVELPCKVGQDIYYINDKRKIVHRIAREYRYLVDLGWEITATNWEKDKNGYSQLKTTIIHSEEIGKTVFLTKAEAEARLQELRGGK